MARWWRRRRAERAVARDPELAIRRALVAVLDGDLAQAEALLLSVVRADSSEFEGYLALARLFRQRGELGRSIQLHQNLLLRRDGPPGLRLDALRGLAEDFRAGGFLRRAISAYEEVVRDRPEEPRALRALISLHVDTREPRRAVPLVRRLARVEGVGSGAAEARLWAQVAEAERQEGHTEAARKALARAVRRDPGFARAWVALGEVESERGRSRRAIAAWRRAPELDRRVGPRVYPRLAAAFASAGRSRAFETWLRGLLEEQAGDSDARIALAQALAARGAADDAVSELRATLDREPDALLAHVALGRLLRSENRDAEAARAHEELLAVLEQRSDLGRVPDAGEAFE